MGIILLMLPALIAVRIIIDLIINSYKSIKMLNNITARLTEIEKTINGSQEKEEGDK